MRFILITNHPGLAAYAVEAGVSRIMVDLEILGKRERQANRDTLISAHEMSEVPTIRRVLDQSAKGELMVRLNPLHPGSGVEVDSAVAAGADLLMLPMWRSPEDLERFSGLVDGRARVVPLLETPEAMRSLDKAVRIQGVSEFYIGLNDLHLALGLDFMFEPLALGMVDDMTAILRSAGLPFGFGGIARVGQGMLPAEIVLGEHLRLGSSIVILSRAFHGQSKGANGIPIDLDLAGEIAKLMEAESGLALRDRAAEERDRRAVAERVRAIASSMRARREGGSL